ncbi:uncharacterized protein N7482_010204 [Penicillium canariense]|uniref:Hepatocellular carcinoma-associated antigen 59-domain-containing protein n=1 Tax=Penicillium canariense TaxID=189055 RepID=A0A9W9LE65_9EURO|nr:uncharacterized protein N7482_010204 [Penicillium canariense]KAJ5150952.1 hypothetical protein N7482_010204 [Penicillium canariense]
MHSTIMDTEVDVPPETLFRPAKRRKFARRRPDDPHETASPAAEPVTESSDKDLRGADSRSHLDGDEDSTQEPGVVRLRRPNPARKGGIGFSATSRLIGKDDSRQMALGPVGDQEKATIPAVGDRFTAYTGQSVDVDRHMMAYIDSEMAKRYHRSPLPDGSNADQSASQPTFGGPSIPGQAQQERLPASLGKLHEIDLGQETKLQNIARTEAATRRLAGDEDSPASGESGPPTERTGPTAKPWRNRKRRTSADVERDRLVEEVLRESKLDVYDEPEEELQADDEAADDRIAEQFRRDFLDAIQSRRRTRTVTKTATKTEVPKGPKLGGSRSARAAMRESQAQSGRK